MVSTVLFPPAIEGYFEATFIDRPNRFIVHCRKSDGEVIRAHLPNPGRLRELFLPGVELLVLPAPTKRTGPPRNTAYTVIAVLRHGFPIFLHTGLTNDIVALLIAGNHIPALAGWNIRKREVRVERSRFDFLLERHSRQLYLEVKSCTLFGNDVAMFPDAITTRGRRHLQELAEMAATGVEAAVLFAIHSPSVKWFMPDYHTDLAFSQTLLSVAGNLDIFAVSLPWTRDLAVRPPARMVPIPWAHLETEIADRGSYLLLLRLDAAQTVRIGRLGPQRFLPGHYLYVGSAMTNLTARMERHKRKQRKKTRWHIDYLRAVATDAIPLAIRSSSRDECKLARAVSQLYQPALTDFGSSDCDCSTHLFYAVDNPMDDEQFHGLLASFRMRHPR